MNVINELSFEAAYAELESVITKLESSEVPLEDSVALFERGRQLSDHCQTLLDKVKSGFIKPNHYWLKYNLTH